MIFSILKYLNIIVKIVFINNKKISKNNPSLNKPFLKKEMTIKKMPNFKIFSKINPKLLLNLNHYHLDNCPEISKFISQVHQILHQNFNKYHTLIKFPQKYPSECQNRKKGKQLNGSCNKVTFYNQVQKSQNNL